MIKKLLEIHPRLLSLYGALTLYALFSSPTPDNPGMVEMAVAGLLVMAGALMAWRIVRGGFAAHTLWQAAGFILLCYGFSVVLAVGVTHNEIHYVLRDIIPFLFLFLPFLVGDLFVGQPERGRFLIGFVVCMGVVSALRALFQMSDFVFLNFAHSDELFYLANVPTILFAAAIGFVAFLYGVGGRVRLARYGLAVAGLLVFLLGILVMGMTLQRASLAFLAFYALVTGGVMAWRRPRILLFLLPLAFLLAWPLWADLSDLVSALVSKTEQYGLNNRAQEWGAVWSEATQDPLRLVFGGGWGATFNSPAVAGARVNFTHGVFGAAVLKTGLFGAGLMALYLLGLTQMLWALAWRALPVALAIAGPFMIDVLLYGAYKSLDFGVLILLIPVALLSGFSSLSVFSKE